MKPHVHATHDGSWCQPAPPGSHSAAPCAVALQYESSARAHGACLWLLVKATVKEVSPFEAGEWKWGGVTCCRTVTPLLLPACVCIAWQVVRLGGCLLGATLQSEAMACTGTQAPAAPHEIQVMPGVSGIALY